MSDFIPRLQPADLRIESISPHLDEAILHIRAKQLSHFMGRVHKYYIDDLGLERIDSGPHPGDLDDVSWRIDRFKQSGPVQTAGLEYIGAFVKDESGISNEVGAMLGLLVLRKPEGLCAEKTHQPTEIQEFDVDESIRDMGLGRGLLKRADIHQADEVVLDVAETNLPAQGVYYNYGFKRDNSVPPQKHGIFDVRHITMRASGADFLGRLNRKR